MKKVVQLPAIANEGRFANKLIHYIVGKCYAESVGATVEIPIGWLAESVFEISEPHIQRKARVIAPTQLDMEFSGAVALPPFFNLPHRVVDKCLRRESVKRLLKWRSGMVKVDEPLRAVIHIRRGDFLNACMFPYIPLYELYDAIESVGLDRSKVVAVNENFPRRGEMFPAGLEFLEDFQTLMLAENVFVYPRSTFSQIAALLGDGNIYMPYDYGRGPTTCKFKLADPSKPVIFPTKNNNLP